MATIDSLFVLHRATSRSFDDHEPGLVPFVSNSAYENGVVGYVEPLPEDSIFEFTGIAISALAGAMVHVPPFIARGSAGSGLVVLEPRTPMTTSDLAYLAAYFNRTESWRFHWYRQLTLDRLLPIQMPDAIPSGVQFQVARHCPSSSPAARPPWKVVLQPIALRDIFHFKAGDYHALDDLLPGTTPVIACGDEENGIAGFFDVEPRYDHALTIAMNGATLATKYHPYRFAAKDDVVICTPKASLPVSTLLFIQVMLNRERWRYSYYRKCYMNKLPRFEVKLLVKDGELDEPLMERLISTAPYWDYIKSWSAPLDS